MPLKPIYGKVPLTSQHSLPLRPGQVRMDNEQMKQLCRLAEDARSDKALWAAAFRLLCVVSAKPEESAVAGGIRDALAHQQPDGGLDMSIPEAVQVMNAAMALYEYAPHRPLLAQMMAWCGFLASRWEDVLACGEVRVHPAALMELLEKLYALTGRKALLTLLEQLRQRAMDWSGILHTFAVQRPMSRMMSWQELDAGMSGEGGDEAGFHTRQYWCCHSASLAEGARAAALSGLFSGSSRDLTACKAGWERISRYHGAVCGGTTGDEEIEGASPSAAVDAAALGAWMEAFAWQGTIKEDAAPYAAMETILCNGLPGALVGGKLIPFQRVNGQEINCGTKDCYHVTEGDAQGLRALNGLLRGWSAAAYSAVTTTEEGAAVNLPMPGRYGMKLCGVPARITLSAEGGKISVTLSLTEPVTAAISLRTPGWTKDACITVNDEGGHEGHPNTYLTLKREWHDGDVITAAYAEALTVAEGYHQGVSVWLGGRLLAYAPAEGEPFAVALCGEPTLAEGVVTAPLRQVAGWRKRGGLLADLPVWPETEGDTFMGTLTPYDETPCRIALFPRGKQS